MKIAIIGGGAAGYFSAIAIAENNSTVQVVIYESTGNPLSKVRISGGGRCNVTHNCFDPAVLVKYYPRGMKELLGAFNQFHPKDTVKWFERRGAKLKAEADGRIFPITDRSSTIIDTLVNSAQSVGVELKLNTRVKSVTVNDEADIKKFEITLASGEIEKYDRLVLATGGSKAGFKLAEMLGHEIIPPIPSLFSFNIDDPRLKDLAGTSFENIKITLKTGKKKRITEEGSLLITHWGLSGPAILRLSSRAARELNKQGYQFEVEINFLPTKNTEEILKQLKDYGQEHSRQNVISRGVHFVPFKYWQRIVTLSGIDSKLTWANLSKQGIKAIVNELSVAKFKITGKSTNKEEFVTCGGVKLREIDFKSMQSKLIPGLFFAGEILDIDALTGGFNFQNAWTTGWIAGQNISS